MAETTRIHKKFLVDVHFRPDNLRNLAKENKKAYGALVERIRKDLTSTLETYMEGKSFAQPQMGCYTKYVDEGEQICKYFCCMTPEGEDCLPILCWPKPQQ